MTENTKKLFNLFNEYNYLQAEGDKALYRPRSEKDWQGMSRPYRQYICSKHFEFVKWLLREEKIDTKYLDTVTVRDKIFKVEKRKSGEERLLMLLALQEDPITFLATILK